jgi:hypothetical protein
MRACAHVCWGASDWTRQGARGSLADLEARPAPPEAASASDPPPPAPSMSACTHPSHPPRPHSDPSHGDRGGACACVGDLGPSLLGQKTPLNAPPDRAVRHAFAADGARDAVRALFCPRSSRRVTQSKLISSLTERWLWADLLPPRRRPSLSTLVFKAKKGGGERRESDPLHHHLCARETLFLLGAPPDPDGLVPERDESAIPVEGLRRGPVMVRREERESEEDAVPLVSSRNQRLFRGAGGRKKKLPKRGRRAAGGPRRPPRTAAEYQGVFHIHQRRLRAVPARLQGARMARPPESFPLCWGGSRGEAERRGGRPPSLTPAPHARWGQSAA